MTDLCYNCLSCHFPAPCKDDLAQCEICYAWGHQYIFCPRGVHLKTPDYRFYALCHNCDIWHLPEPCSQIMHTCMRCTHPGHLEFFCPVNPTSRTAQPEKQSIEEEAHHPTPLPGRHLTVDNVGIMSHDTITRVKLDAVDQAFRMLEQGYLPFQIMEFMGGPYGLRHTSNPALANARLAAVGHRHAVATLQQPPQGSQPQIQPGTFVQPTIKQNTGPERRVSADSSTWRRIESRPTGPDGGKHADVPGTYTTMQQRFDQGDLAKTVEQMHPLDVDSQRGALSVAQTMSQLLEATQRTQTMTPRMEDANVKVSRGDVPQSALLKHLMQQATPTLQQATPGTGSVTSKKQDATSEMMADASLSTKQAMSQLQGATPSMEDAASPAQNSTMITETMIHGENTEDMDDTSAIKVLNNSKKKMKLSTKTEMEGTPAGTINQGPRCAKCIKAHKRCTHRTQGSPASNLPLGSSPFETPSSPNYIPSNGVPEGYTPAPITMPDQSFTLPATSAEVPVQAAAKKATPKRKR